MSAPAVAAKPFAKLFETEHGQILALRGPHPDTSAPEIRFFFDPAHPALGLCSVALTFPDSDGGEAAANAAFAAVSQAGAKKMVGEQLDMIQRMGDAAA